MKKQLAGAFGLIATFLFVAVSTNTQVLAASESVLWNFGGSGDGAANPNNPPSGVIADEAGNLYGTTLLGGANGAGVVYELNPPSAPGNPWTESILWNFGSGSDGVRPSGGVIFDKNGNLFGNTAQGGNQGIGSCSHFNGTPVGCGTVFELSPPATIGGQWTESIIWNFGTNDMIHPGGDLIADGAGNFFGLALGGVVSDFEGIGGGAVFELSPPVGGDPWTESVLWLLGNRKGDGIQPSDRLVLDQYGDLFGVTFFGGTNTSKVTGIPLGTAFELAPPTSSGGAWSESVIWDFGKGNDGTGPSAGLVFDATGNLYGTTSGGGTGKGGTAFKLAPPRKAGGKWKESSLWQFRKTLKNRVPDGAVPGSLIMDSKGNLYGTTAKGGSFGGKGIAFELSLEKNTWKETILWNFGQGDSGTSGPDGEVPSKRLFMDAAGNLFGTTVSGGTFGQGTVFEIKP